MTGIRARRFRPHATGTENRSFAWFIAPSVFLAVSILLILPALQPGKVLAPVDLMYESPIYAANRPDGYVEPVNPHLFDQAFQFVPWRSYAWERMRDGELPLWNPLSAAGTPFVATMQSAVFYPVNLLTLPLPFRSTFAASAILRLWIAGFATYLLLQQYGSSRQAGVLGGISFMLSGFIVSWLGHPHTNVAIWLPALILAFEKLLAGTTRRDMMRWWAVLAIVTGIQFLGGHIETSRDILFAAGLYAVVRLVQLPGVGLHRGVRTLSLAALGVAAGAGIAAVQLLPFLEWLPLSAEYRDRSQSSFSVWNFDFEPLLALPLAVMPNLYGNPTWDGQYWSFNPWGSFNESVLYAGTIPLVLAIAALARWRSDPIVSAWVIVGGLMLGIAMRLPVLDWVNQLPGFALGHPGRLRLIALFAIAILAGRGLDWISARSPATLPRRLMTISLIGISTLCLSVLILFNFVFPLVDNWETRAVSRLLNHFSGAASPPRSVLVCRDRIESCGDELAQAFAITNLDMYLALPVAVLGLVILRASRTDVVPFRWLGPTLAGVAALELLVVGWGFNPAVVSASLTEEPPALVAASEAAGDGRLTVLQQDSLPDSHMLYGFEDVRGLDFKTDWYEMYIDTADGRIPWLANGILLESASPVVTNLSVGAVVTTNPHLVDRHISEGSMRHATTVGDVFILRPLQAAPRGAMRFDVRIADTDEAAVAMLEEDPARLDSQVILADSPAARRLAATVSTDDPNATATVIRREPEYVAFEVDSQVAGLLVVSDAYYPGWTATVDGDPAEIHRANIAFRAVLVEPGRHTVEMRYEPRSIRYGIIVSVVSTIVAFGILGFSFLTPSARRSIYPARLRSQRRR